MRSEIRDRNNKRDTSFKLACLTAGCRDFEGKRSEIRDRNNEHDTSVNSACLTSSIRDFRGKEERDWDCSLNWTQVFVIV